MPPWPPRRSPSSPAFSPTSPSFAPELSVRCAAAPLRLYAEGREESSHSLTSTAAAAPRAAQSGGSAQPTPRPGRGSAQQQQQQQQRGEAPASCGRQHVRGRGAQHEGRQTRPRRLRAARTNRAPLWRLQSGCEQDMARPPPPAALPPTAPRRAPYPVLSFPPWARSLARLI